MTAHGSPTSALDRVLELIAAARRIVDPSDHLGQRARVALQRSTGLSPQGLELALAHCLEIDPSEAELRALCASAAPARRAHVSLSANVFVAAHRAIALALAASPRVFVRASRREPEMAALLHEAAPRLFEVCSSLEPIAGDHFFAYGSDATTGALASTLPRGVVLHAHGAGFAVAVTESTSEDVASRLAFDIALFDQRGCLSPRAAIVCGGAPGQFAARLAAALDGVEARVPRGDLLAEELAAIARYRDSLLFAGDVVPAGQGYVSTAEKLVVAPPGRNCHVCAHADPVAALEPFKGALTSIGFEGSPELAARLAKAFPSCRISAIGAVQTPPFDGPVDLRAPREGCRLE